MQWQSIETAPKDGTWILAIIKGTVRGKPIIPSVVCWLSGKWLCCDEVDMDDDEIVGDYKPTHWMPLPEAP